MPAISKVTPANQTIYWDRTGAVPDVAVLSVIVMEAPEPEVTYVQFYIEKISGNIDWLSSEKAGEYLSVTGDTIPLEFINLDKLYPGNFQTKVDIFIDGVDGTIRQLTALINLNISGEPPISITTDQENYDVVYQRSTNTFSGETTVNILNNADLDPITFETSGTLFKEVSLTDTFTLEEDPAFPFATNAELPAAGILVVNCRLKKDGVYICNFTVTIAVIGENEIITNPEFLDFKIRKGYDETETRSLQIINPLNIDFTVTKPAWLVLSANSGNATSTISVTTVNSETITPGTYSGNIEIAYGAKICIVPVSLLVTEFVNITDKDFCLDEIILTATKQEESAKILRISMLAKFHTHEKKVETTAVYDIMYQNGFAKTDIGKKVHQMFPRNRNSLFLDPKTKPFENILVYKPAKIKITVEELDISYGIKKTLVLPEIFLYPGNRPTMFPLFTNHAARRRMNGDGYIFTYLADEVSPIDIVGSAVASNPVLPKEVHTVKIEDSDALITWTNPKTILDVEFYEFTEREVIQVEWQNQNLAQEWFSFTGEFTLSEDKMHVYQENSFTVNNEKFDVRNSYPLKINTGFILKNEASLISELVDSKICFIKIKDLVYRAFCIQQKLVKEDSLLELYQYDLDFLIIK